MFNNKFVFDNVWGRSSLWDSSKKIKKRDAAQFGEARLPDLPQSTALELPWLALQHFQSYCFTASRLSQRLLSYSISLILSALRSWASVKFLPIAHYIRLQFTGLFEPREQMVLIQLQLA